MDSLIKRDPAAEMLEGIYKPTRSATKKSSGDRPPYMIEYGNWYKTIPYGFRIEPPPFDLNAWLASVGPSALGNFSTTSFFFPVNPESISISTPYAVQVTPTMGGIVEEHSGAVFYNITISGTTGVIPEIDFLQGTHRSPDEVRTMATDKPLIKSGFLGGFGSGTINAINSAVSKITGVESKLVDGSVTQKTGYTAFHVLYKFIWLYHHGKANGIPFKLIFANYKDNNQYNVIVQNFQLSRDKNRPHLYQYTIQMKAWNLSNNTSEQKFESSQRLADLGLDSGPSFKAKMFRVINTTKSTLNAAAGLLNTAAQDLAF